MALRNLLRAFHYRIKIMGLTDPLYNSEFLLRYTHAFTIVLNPALLRLTTDCLESGVNLTYTGLFMTPVPTSPLNNVFKKIQVNTHSKNHLSKK
ncbi:hypothetical protein PanWU01x14_096500 [Parasponia andersonii]|uniref:Uncharacterized protein n=1 Tax=Parasponia andersonii TaxID=3476 RepID=A0A2P5D4U6_PARAD|nr:hypothetical protein PanWU01x14_096500 [Parasponia andersonii]